MGGCKMSHEIEDELRRTFWWISNTRAYTLVRVWIRNKEKIGRILAEKNIQSNSEENERHYKHQYEQHGEARPTSS